jgi:hypothetical protein
VSAPRAIDAQFLQAVVGQLYRLFRTATLHLPNNEAVGRSIREATRLFEGIGAAGLEGMSVLFLSDTVFVNGKLLKAPREVYETALELARFLEKTGYNEIWISAGATDADVQVLVEFLARKWRAMNESISFADTGASLVRLRHIDPEHVVGVRASDLTPNERAVRAYTFAVVLMRRAFETLRQGDLAVPDILKRLAHELVVLAQMDLRAVLDITRMRRLNQDEAGRAVHTAILAVAMGLQVTKNRRVLARLAMEALLFESGRPRVSGLTADSPRTVLPPLTPEQRSHVAASSAVVLLGAAKARDESLHRAVVTFDAQQALAQADDAGDAPPSAGVEPLILAVAWRFNDLLTFQIRTQQRTTPDDAIDRLRRSFVGPVAHLCIDMLASVLRIYPRGTVVRTTTGWTAVVVAVPESEAKASFPTLQLLRDPDERAISGPVVDMASPGYDAVRYGVIDAVVHGFVLPDDVVTALGEHNTRRPAVLSGAVGAEPEIEVRRRALAFDDTMGPVSVGPRVSIGAPLVAPVEPRALGLAPGDRIRSTLAGTTNPAPPPPVPAAAAAAPATSPPPPSSEADFADAGSTGRRRIEERVRGAAVGSAAADPNANVIAQVKPVQLTETEVRRRHLERAALKAVPSEKPAAELEGPFGSGEADLDPSAAEAVPLPEPEPPAAVAAKLGIDLDADIAALPTGPARGSKAFVEADTAAVVDLSDLFGESPTLIVAVPAGSIPLPLNPRPPADEFAEPPAPTVVYTEPARLPAAEQPLPSPRVEAPAAQPVPAAPAPSRRAPPPPPPGAIAASIERAHPAAQAAAVAVAPEPPAAPAFVPVTSTAPSAGTAIPRVQREAAPEPEPVASTAPGVGVVPSRRRIGTPPPPEAPAASKASRLDAMLSELLAAPEPAATPEPPAASPQPSMPPRELDAAAVALLERYLTARPKADNAGGTAVSKVTAQAMRRAAHSGPLQAVPRASGQFPAAADPGPQAEAARHASGPLRAVAPGPAGPTSSGRIPAFAPVPGGAVRVAPAKFRVEERATGAHRRVEFEPASSPGDAGTAGSRQPGAVSVRFGAVESQTERAPSSTSPVPAVRRESVERPGGSPPSTGPIAATPATTPSAPIPALRSLAGPRVAAPVRPAPSESTDVIDDARAVAVLKDFEQPPKPAASPRSFGAEIATMIGSPASAMAVEPSAASQLPGAPPVAASGPLRRAPARPPAPVEPTEVFEDSRAEEVLAELLGHDSPDTQVTLPPSGQPRRHGS